MLLVFIPYLLFLPGSLSLDQEKIIENVKIKKTMFKCTFVLITDNSEVLLKKSNVQCTPSKPKRQKVSNLEIKGEFGVYTISFKINPSKITRAALSPKEITTTPGPTVPPPTSCGLGNSKICTQGTDGKCLSDMNLQCFGNSSNKPVTEGMTECGCLNTITLKDALADGRNPLGTCDSLCLCIPSTLTSPCHQVTKSILITGGGNGENGGATKLETSELYGGPAGCIVPSLPRPRAGHVTFTTADGLVATCGGLEVTGDRTRYTNSCLVLRGNHSWEEDPSKMGNLDRKRYSGAVVSLPVGVYVMGGQYADSSFLPTGDTVWQVGPSMRAGTSSTCGVAISQTSFLRIGGYDAGINSVQEYDSSNPTGPTSDSGWKPQDTWPDVTNRRYSHACTLYQNKVIVAGGNTYSKSIEMIDLTTKTISAGPDMLEDREFFGMTTLQEGENIRLLVFGGFPSYTGNVEELDEDTNSWTSMAVGLGEKRAHFGYVAISEETENMICNG